MQPGAQAPCWKPGGILLPGGPWALHRRVAGVLYQHLTEFNLKIATSNEENRWKYIVQICTAWMVRK